jgi:hypothetical protein
VVSRDQGPGNSNTTVLKKNIPLGQLNAAQVAVADSLTSQPFSDSQNGNSILEEDNLDSDESDDDDPLMVFRTVSCKAQYSRSAKHLVLCCFVEDALNGGIYVRLFVFDSTTFNLIAKRHQSVEFDGKSDGVNGFQIIFSPCDTLVYILLRCDEPSSYICCMEIPKDVSLSGSCRATIMRSLNNSRNVNVLPVPCAIKRFLQFQSNKYGEQTGPRDEE